MVSAKKCPFPHLNEKFGAVLTLGVGEDLRRLYYGRLISALHVKGKSVSNLV